MPLLDGTYYNGCEVDNEFVRISEMLLRCPHLDTYKECEMCIYYKKCDRLFAGLSECAVHHRLNKDDVMYYRRRYMELAGIRI